MIFSYKSQHNKSDNKNNNRKNITQMPIQIQQTRTITHNVIETPASTKDTSNMLKALRGTNKENNNNAINEQYI